jgi:hypothetical protein
MFSSKHNILPASLREIELVRSVKQMEPREQDRLMFSLRNAHKLKEKPSHELRQRLGKFRCVSPGRVAVQGKILIPKLCFFVSFGIRGFL